MKHESIEFVKIESGSPIAWKDRRIRLDEKRTKLKGIWIEGKMIDGLVFESLILDNKVLIPRHTPAKLFMTDLSVAPNDRFYKMDEDYKFGDLRFSFEEGFGHGSVMNMYLLLGND